MSSPGAVPVFPNPIPSLPAPAPKQSQHPYHNTYTRRAVRQRLPSAPCVPASYIPDTVHHSFHHSPDSTAHHRPSTPNCILC